MLNLRNLVTRETKTSRKRRNNKELILDSLKDSHVKEIISLFQEREAIREDINSLLRKQITAYRNALNIDDQLQTDYGQSLAPQQMQTMPVEMDHAELINNILRSQENISPLIKESVSGWISQNRESVNQMAAQELKKINLKNEPQQQGGFKY